MTEAWSGMAGEDKILTVSALTELISREIESRFPFVWVRGEISDYSLAQSGHMYFSLKDSRSLLQCVWFAGKRKSGGAGQKFDPLTGEVFETPRPDPALLMRNGLEVICAGSVGVYAPSGRHQLIVELAEPVGAGAQLLILEERKARLARAGYFALARKRSVPPNPACVALVTSPRGAALHDFLKMSHFRGLPSRIRLFPVPVQGEGAAEKIAGAIDLINDQAWAELIVLIRGGGSSEDLGEFNEEILANAIFRSRLPVVTGIGHEVDTSIADLTADLRAATPTHAAQLLWPLRDELVQKVDSRQLALEQAIQQLLKRKKQNLERDLQALNLLSPVRRLASASATLKLLLQRLRRESRAALERRLQGLIYNVQRLKSQDRLRVLLAANADKLARLEMERRLGFERLLARSQTNLEASARNLISRCAIWLKDKDTSLRFMENVLAQRNPLLPLRHGYALLYTSEGIIASVSRCRPGDTVSARLSDGEMILKVEAVRPGSHSLQGSDIAGEDILHV